MDGQAYARRKCRALGCVLLVLGMAFVPVHAFVEEATVVVSEFEHPVVSAPEVPECAPVEDAYFARAVFVGDSMADGIAIHNVIPEIQVMARIGLSPRTAASDALFKSDGKPVTLAKKLPEMRPSAVYLWLGSNGLVSGEAEKIIDDYDRLLNKLLRALPNTPFYLLEVTPVQALSQPQYEGFTNERIDAFNEELHEVAERHNVYVLPVNAMLKDGESVLDETYAGSDGIHLRKEAYEMIGSYLYTHALPVIEEETEVETEAESE